MKMTDFWECSLVEVNLRFRASRENSVDRFLYSYPKFRVHLSHRSDDGGSTHL
jgi:hypothetical protein